MSLQRILEVARRRGMPVVMTDVAGREPMVVMPLAEYERLAETPSAPQGTRSANQKKTPLSALASVDDEDLVMENVADSVTSRLGAEVEKAAKEWGEAPVDDGMSLEERFFLEPVEEDQVK